MEAQAINVLLVEDDASHAELIRRSFEYQPELVNLIVVGTLREARAKIAKQAPDIMICDLRLPDGEGTELLPSEGEKCDFPTLIMTANGSEQAAVNAMKGGAIDYVIKSDILMINMPRYAHRALREWSLIEERKQAEKRARQSEKLSALGKLAAGVAHDFNNSLAIMLSHLDFMRGMEENPEKIARIEIVQNAGLSAAQTVKRLQDFSRRQTPQRRTPVDLKELVLETIDMTRPRWKDESQAGGIHVELRADFPDDQITVIGNQLELQEGLINLINNSLDAMPKGGRITISAKNLGRNIRLTVQDTGKGMSEETRLRAFEPFYTEKMDRGTGLGLSIVHSIMERNGGQVEIESSPDMGTSVHLTFPAIRETGGEETTGEEVSDVCSHIPSSRILVIDDEPEISDILKEFFESEGHTAEAFTNPIDGVNRFKETPFDLVVTDLGMSNFSGWKVAESVKKIKPGTPVILITGWGENLDPEKLEQSDISKVLAKPFSMAAMRESILGALLHKI